MADFETIANPAFVNPSLMLADPFTASNHSWTEIHSATASAWGGFYVHAYAASPRRGILCVAVGAVGSEQIIASIPMGLSMTSVTSFYVPIPVAAGSRVSVAMSTHATGSVFFDLYGVKASVFDATPNWTVMESGPYNLASDAAQYGKGIAIDSGATANARGAYTELSNGDAANLVQGNSLANGYDYAGILITNNALTSQNNYYFQHDFAIGAAGSEVNFLTGRHHRTRSTENEDFYTAWNPRGFAAGDRVSVRSQCSGNDAAKRITGAYILGVR